MDPRNLSISDFTYALPEEKIAKYPLAKRDRSKLLIYKDGKITADIYKNIADHLPLNSLLIFNNTKVIEARLLFQKPTGAMIEVFCLEPHEQYTDVTQAMSTHKQVLWYCLIGGASKWKRGQILEKKISTPEKDILLTAKWIDKKHDSFIIQLSWSDDSLNFAEVLHLAGVIPLPPYIKRQTEQSDEERYQTIYAQHEGSVAAPTAGLHFTESIFDSLKAKEINSDFVTLHVGAGTFKPVKSETMAGHEMHAEFIEVSLTTIENILRNIHKPIIPVGTTSLRTIETLYWMGVKVSRNEQPRDLSISQWEPYETKSKDITPADALHVLIDHMKRLEMDKIISRTQILIAPGYQPKLATALVTNFHQPQSTLLLLVAALIGNDWKKIYDYAMNNDFRFLSYGDGSLLFINDQAGTADIAG